MAGPGSILIADDEDTFLRSTAQLLRREGYDCDCAADADQALAMLQAQHYDLLIADIKMPGNADLRVVRQGQQLAEGMSVILVTGYPSVETAVHALGLPVAAYLTKPLDFQELHRQVRACLERSRTHRALAAARRRLESCIAELVEAEQMLSHPRSGSLPAAIASPASATLRALGACLRELHDLDGSIARDDPPPPLCDLVCCPRRDRLEAALEDAVRSIERTKSAFKSKELGQLRARLEGAMKGEASAATEP